MTDPAPQLVEIATDGACKGNPGPGGWGALLRFGSHGKELSGGETLTTNNRMELTAAIQALRILTRPCKVKLSTDSKYVMDGLTRWIHGWQKNGWRTADKKPVRTSNCGRRCSPRRRNMTSSGSGSKATPATPTTNASTNWRAMPR